MLSVRKYYARVTRYQTAESFMFRLRDKTTLNLEPSNFEQTIVSHFFQPSASTAKTSF